MISFNFLVSVDCLTSFYWFKKQPTSLMNINDLVNEYCNNDAITLSDESHDHDPFAQTKEREEMYMYPDLDDNLDDAKSVESQPKRKRKSSITERLMRIKNRLLFSTKTK